MTRTPIIVTAVVLALVLGGCFPDVEESSTACVASTDCFAGEQCVGGVCVAGSSATGDAGSDVVEADMGSDSGGEDDVAVEDVGDDVGVDSRRILEGTVTDFIDGSPVRMAFVVVDVVGAGGGSTTTDSLGKYEYEFNTDDDATLVVTASKNGFHTESFSTSFTTDQNALNLDLQLLPLRITGRVTDANFPNVSVAGISVSTENGLAPVTTDSDGRFVFTADDLPANNDSVRTFRVIFNDPNRLYATNSVEGVVLGGEPRNPSVSIALECNSSETNVCGGCGIDLEGQPGEACEAEPMCPEEQEGMWTCDEFGGVVCRCM